MNDRTNPTPTERESALNAIEDAYFLIGVIEAMAPDVMRRAEEVLQRRRERRQLSALHIEANASAHHDGGQR